MKIAKKEDFGLILMKFLVKNYSENYIPLSFVAKKTHLSPFFLKHIALSLKEKKLIESKEGVKGGYRLAKDPREISVAQVIRAISTDIVKPSCIKGKCRVKKEACSFLSFWDKVNKQLFLYLQKVSLWEFASL